MKREPKTILDVVDQLVPGDNENRSAVDVASDAADVIETAILYARTKRLQEQAHALAAAIVDADAAQHQIGSGAWHAASACCHALDVELDQLVQRLPDPPEEESSQVYANDIGHCGRRERRAPVNLEEPEQDHA